jgi:cytochrome c biogenesis protein CcmG/thiol:disulfide interchange protein DsbE
VKNKILWVAAAAVIVLLAVIAVVASGGDDAGDPAAAAAATRPVTVSGDALPPLADPQRDVAVGSVAPTLEGAAFDGSPMAIEPGDGRAKIVLFVAHWCPHCQREVPFLVRHLAEEPLPDDVELVTVSTGVDEKAPNYPPQEWLSDEGWDHPVLADSAEGAAADAFGLTSFPYFVAIGADGSVTARASGELTADELDALVQTVRR